MVASKPSKQVPEDFSPDNPEQYRRFVETARELEVDESREAMDRAFERVVGKPKTKSTPRPKNR